MDSERRGLPPAHPSLPKAPQFQSSQIQSAVTTALANPYSQPSYGQYQPSYSSHYAQAYMQANAPGWSTTPHGYTLSPSYLNGTSAPEASSSGSMYTTRLDSRPSQSFNSQSFSSGSSTWYQPGDHRCKHNGCNFSGSQKAVEVHMMDRHLIYPPGWEKRKKREDWDADPSLKGKPIPIQGTTIILDSPEVLEAWIAERKKRWPSAARVEEKKRKMEEAIARGQLSPEDAGFGKKRRRVQENANEDVRTPGREGNDRGRGRGRGRGTDSGWRGRGRGGAGNLAGPSRDEAQPSFPPATQHIAVISDSNSDSEDEDNDSPEIISSKPLDATAQLEGEDPDRQDVSRELSPIPNPQVEIIKPIKKPSSHQPKKLPRNPFASRPTLLRNLLLPEIRITVSNLSQAIRFLVDNDFLEGVELKPGQAKEKMIEVIQDSPSLPDQVEPAQSEGHLPTST